MDSTENSPGQNGYQRISKTKTLSNKLGLPRLCSVSKSHSDLVKVPFWLLGSGAELAFVPFCQVPRWKCSCTSQVLRTRWPAFIPGWAISSHLPMLKYHEMFSILSCKLKVIIKLLNISWKVYCFLSCDGSTQLKDPTKNNRKTSIKMQSIEKPRE